MDLSSVTLQASCSFPVRTPTLAVRAIRNSARITFCCSSSRLEALARLGNTCSTQRKNSSSRNSKHYRATTDSTSHYRNPSDISSCQEIPDADFCDGQSVSQWLVPDRLALWLRSSRSLKEVRSIHAVVVKCFRESVIYMGNNLISTYLGFGKVVEARKVFDKLPNRNVVTWTALINGYLNVGLDDEALRLFNDSIENGIRANEKMFVCVLNMCSRRSDFELGSQFHACIVKGGSRNLIVDSSIVHFYAQCRKLPSAFRAFDRMQEQDVVCWTTMITACAQQGHGQEAISLFSRMLSNGSFPNEFTVCGVLKACGEEKAFKFGRQLHGTIVKKMFRNDVFVGTSLVDMYAKCGEMLDSKKVFNRMRYRNMVTWTSFIAGYARKGLGEEAIRLFRVMKRRKINSNNWTIVSVLRACGSIEATLLGRELHAQIIKKSIKTNIYIASTLVWFYCRCAEYNHAFKVLQQMPRRDVVSWTAIISGGARLGHESEALEFLGEMMEEGVDPNSFTYSSALKACANLETVRLGKLIHSCANKTPSLSNVFVGSALINMYAKCGYLSEASQVFDSMPDRNLVSWKAMIMGYAKNGLCQEALKLMYRMKAEGIVVDDYIIATVLAACGDFKWDMEASSEYCLLST
ncbi:pentatricopeptide repeat-containing protein At4g18520, chloroplastic-like [Juglans microcarpa x Juglans regia]|uniref:pentatricopeptide repeat-containing protein At4g18520, chloroplastic-like n=1 Tax=Juglans microcarpa x Juglans regia TaxID=2249226 RepID=UPI001B7DA74E|nr:pentatricopeptide repeat-containing protein At4g18520, chloroplastic-like [Juglans microcarpa x Juglans regia]